MEPKFTGPSYTIGIEEELMILDAESLGLANAIEQVLSEYGEDRDDIKHELLEPVLEIATDPHPDTQSAGEQLRALRRSAAALTARRSSRSCRPAALVSGCGVVAISSTGSSSSGLTWSSSPPCSSSTSSIALASASDPDSRIISSSSIPIV